MKVDGIHCIAAAAALLLLSATARSQDAAAARPLTVADAAVASADMPYSSIVARNIFGLVPIPPPDPDAGKPPVEPPPKITPNGIMTIFGRDQALFKVATKPKPGQPPKDDSYVLSEGERQDDIEVVKIDHVSSIITFNNHGIVQALPLVPAKDVGGPAPGPGSGGGVAPGGVRPGFPGANLRGKNMNSASAGGNGNGSLGNPNSSGGGNNGSMNGFNSGAGNNNPNSPQSQANIEDQVMSAARQMALIEQARMDTQDQVNQGTMPPLPPTPLTPDEALSGGGNGGAPLVGGLPQIPSSPRK